MKNFALLLSLALTSARLFAAPVELLPAELRGAVQPQVAVSPAGRIHVVFGKETSIYYTSSADGRTYSAPVKVAELDKLALGMRRGPRIAAAEKAVVISAISHSEGDLHAWTSADGGKTWMASKINDTPHSAREGLHAMSGDGRGTVAVVWLDDRGGSKEVRGAVSKDGGTTWGANTLVYHSPDGHVCECCTPGVAVGANGKIVAMWRNWLGGARDMYTATSSDGGQTFGVAEKLGAGTWKFNACPMDGGTLSLGKDGQVLTAWRREKTVFAAAPGSPEQKLADSAFQPLVVEARGGADYLWEAGGGLMVKKGSASPVRFAEKAAFAAAAARPDGKPIVVWQGEVGSAKTIFANFVD